MAAKTPLTDDERSRLAALRAAAAAGNYYALLGVKRNATNEEVAAAYQGFVKSWHPDRFFARDVGPLSLDIEDNFVAVTRAYRTLMDKRLRSAYEAEFTKNGGVLPEPDRTVTDHAEPEPAAGATPPAHEVVIGKDHAGKRQIKHGNAPPAPPKVPIPPILDAMKKRAAEQLKQARDYFVAGKTNFDAGQYAKAESSLYLATRYDPGNQEYQDLLKKAVDLSRKQRVTSFLAMAEQAEQYGNHRDAMAQFRKVLEADPEHATALFRLARLVRTHDDDEREAIQLLRRAVLKEPKNVDFRVALAEAYVDLDMAVNAQRELAAAFDVDPKHAGAKALQQKLKKR